MNICSSIKSSSEGTTTNVCLGEGVLCKTRKRFEQIEANHNAVDRFVRWWLLARVERGTRETGWTMIMQIHFF